MTWTAPHASRDDPSWAGEERIMLETWLDFHRQTLLHKCSGLSPEQLALRPIEPSTLSLLGLVRHMTDVERSWFRRRFAGESVGPIYFSDERPDGDIDDGVPADAPAAFANFSAEIDAAREAVAGRSLDEMFVHPRSNQEMNLRWVYVHMIEEYARHNGHADLIRELIDGVTGE
jgi:uncharacterized damage-inducible protein DinB